MSMSTLIQGCKIHSNVSSIDFNNSCSHFATGGRECIYYDTKALRYLNYDCMTTAGSNAKRLSVSTKAQALPELVLVKWPGTNRAQTSSQLELLQDMYLHMRQTILTKTLCRSKGTMVVYHPFRQY